MSKEKSVSSNPEPTSLIVPSITVFISSFCIMVLELVAARLIARHLGSSLYTWTAVIGVVLAGISLGNYVGGRIADRFVARKALSVLFAISSVTCVVTVIANNLVGEWTLLWHLSWPGRIFTHIFLVFMLPSTLLGTISPVVAKMALDRGLPSGRTVGDIYAWSAVGSIAGTFAAGYYLIPAMGTILIVWTIGGILLLMSILYCVSHWPFLMLAIFFLSAMAIGTGPANWCQAAGVALALREEPDPTLVYRDETPYCCVSVKRLSKKPDKRVFVQDKLVHSKIVMGNITNLQYFYTKIYAAITHGLSTDKERLSVMVIGGGGYVYPRYVEKMWPGSLIEVVEIDSGVTKAAIRAFGLEPNTAIKTVTMDGRNYVEQLLHQQRRTDKKRLYDFIYGDAINDYSVPYQLVTKEFNDRISNILTDDGVYMVTLIDIYDYGRFLGSMINTLEQTFSNVYVLTEGRMPKWARNTFVVIAAKRDLDLKDITSRYQKDLDLWCLSSSKVEGLKEKSGRLVLTDEYVPVENLLAAVVRESAKGIVAYEYIENAEKLAKAGKLKESIASYEKAAQAKPELTVEVYNKIGLIYLQQNDHPRAVEALKRAVEYNEQTGASRNISSVYLNLGVALQKCEYEREGREHLQQAVQGFRADIEKEPDSALLYDGLGNALLALEEFDAAREAFHRVVELNPDELTAHLNLAKTLEFQQRYDEAMSMLVDAIDHMKERGRNEDVERLREYLKTLESKK
jgi:spermidine synthase